jgi:ketosteroid isomerase-like protein
MLYDVIAALLFVCSSGLLFNERFRSSRALVLIAGVIALVSTYYLTKQIVDDEFNVLMANKGNIAASPPLSPPASAATAGDSGTGEAMSPPAGAPAQQAEPVSQDEAQTAVNAYLDAWRDGDVDKQASLLTDDFTYTDQDKSQSRADYLAQKRKLAALYGPSTGTASSISVTASGLSVSPAPDGVYVSYTQTYDNPHYHSVGTNTFTVRKFDGTVKIAHESFQRESYETR